MAFEAPSFVIPGLKAEVDLSAKQFHFVKMTGDLQVNAAGSGESAVGILQNDPEVAGAAASVQHLGVSKLYVAATIAAGGLIMPDADGKGVVAASGEAAAIALEAGASGDLLTVLQIAPKTVA